MNEQQARAEMMTRLVQSAVRDAGYTSGARVVCLVCDGADTLLIDVISVLREEDRSVAGQICIEIVSVALDQMMGAHPRELGEPS